MDDLLNSFGMEEQVFGAGEPLPHDSNEILTTHGGENGEITHTGDPEIAGVPDYPHGIGGIEDGPIPGEEEDPTGLGVNDGEINELEERAKGLEREEHKNEPSFGRKMCPTRHGCQGATDCNYSYGSYPG